MKCPRDGTALAKIELLAVELDKCHKCDGIWLDQIEFEQLRDAKVENIEEAFDRKYGHPPYEEGTVDAHMRCPRCGDERLLPFHYTLFDPVTVDRCQRCFGVWLDRGELDAIIAEKTQLEREARTGNAGTLRQMMNRLTKRIRQPNSPI